MKNNAIEYWYPKIKDIVPTPRTNIIPVERKWDKTGNYLYIPKKYVDKIAKETDNFVFPIFLRASDSSVKHDWKDTCFVASKNLLAKHINRIANECECLDVFGGVNVSSYAIREYIEMDSKFKYFWGELPINPERRYFIYNHKVICHHPYWTNESIKEPQYEKLLAEINLETEAEKTLLNGYACKIAKDFDGYWSIDFCRAKSGEWYCIDMAIGFESWHPKCNLRIFNTGGTSMNSIEGRVRQILEDTGTIDIDLALSQILKLTLLNEVKKLSFKEGDIILCKDIELNKQLARLKLPENFPKIPIVLVKDFNDVKLTNLPNELLPKVNNEYQCEHIKEKIIRSSCVWCNLTVAEKIIDRLKRELTNLRPLSEKEVLDLLHMYNYGSLFNGHTEDEINFAKCICSHFSKPQIKYPEKKVCLIEQEANQITNDQLKDYETYKYGYNTCIEDMRRLNGEDKII